MSTLLFNTCAGGPGHLVTTGDGDQHGDAWSEVVGHVAYDERPDTGWPALRLGSPVADPASVEFSVGSVPELSLSVYVWVPSGGRMSLYAGGTGSGAPLVEWTPSELRLGDTAPLAGADDAATRDRLIRVEVSAGGGQVVYRLNHLQPDLTAPDHEASGTYSGDLSLVRLLVPAGHRAWGCQFRIGDGAWLGSAILRPGSGVQPEVRRFQLDLLEAGYELPTWGADGDYGQETVNAVLAFQRDQGLLDDGIAGQQTRGILDQMLNLSRYPTLTGHSGWGIALAEQPGS